MKTYPIHGTVKTYPINGTVTEVCKTERGEIVLLGRPPQTEDETLHNCDAMGCGQSHVLWRSSHDSTDDSK